MLVIPLVDALISKLNRYYFCTGIAGIVLYSILYNSLCSRSLSLKKFNTLYKVKYKGTIEPS